MDLTNNRAPKYVKQNLTELKGDDSVVIGDLHNPLTIMDRAARPKPKKEIRDLSNTINQVHLKASIGRSTDNTLFSSAHGTFSSVDHMLDHKTSLSKFKRIEIMQSTVSDQWNEIRNH